MLADMTLRIRLIDPNDDRAVADLQRRNREFLAPWTPERPEEHLTVAGQRVDIEKALVRHAGGESVPLVILDDEGAVAGRLTLGGIMRGAFQSCSVGYWLAEEHTGRGLATQAVEAAVALAFSDLRLHRVQAETLLDNMASQAVLARTGFERIGMAPRYIRIAGRWRDHLLFQRVDED